MTGIERLRKLSEDMLDLSLWARLATGTEKDWDCCKGDGRTLNDELLSIADQIEREQESLVADSPYDAILPEDRDAIAWVREHGGLENVRDAWDEAVNLCATIGCEPNDESETLQALGDCTDIVIKRLMPEGCEWDGSVLRIRTAENVDYDGETLFVLIGGRDE